MLQEVGPYVQEDGSDDLHENAFSWNSNANLLFLESPPGVGFSYNDDSSYSYTDPNTAQDNYNSLLTFFKKFPAFAGRDFYISGESYAGMYIPFTATAIVNGNAAATQAHINLKGILIGNGAMVMDNVFRQKVTLKYYITRNFIAPETADVINNVCPKLPLAPKCLLAMRQYQTQISGINPYNVYGYCFSDTSDSKFDEPLPYTPWAV
jgi:serine carboxypeptidase-like clade 2